MLADDLLKNKERIQEEIRNSRYTYQNEQDKAGFQHDMAYVDFKDLPRKTTSDEVLCDKAFNIAKNSKKKMDIKVNLHQWFINFLVKIFLVVLLHVQINLLLKVKLCQTNN